MADVSRKRVDVDSAKAHFKTALEGHDQAFETFLFARILGLSFDYLPQDASDANKDICRLTFEVTGA